VNRSAFAASPCSYSSACDTLWATACRARRTDLGRKRFIDFSERDPCESAFIPEHRSKCRPPRIQHRLRVRCLREGRGLYVTDKDSAVLAHQSSGELVQGVLSAIGDFGVNRPHARLLMRALRARELRLQAAVELRREPPTCEFHFTVSSSPSGGDPTPRDEAYRSGIVLSLRHMLILAGTRSVFAWCQEPV